MLNDKCITVTRQSSFYNLDLSVNSFNSSSILNNVNRFTKEFSDILSEQRVQLLTNEKTIFITASNNNHVLHNINFVKLSEFSEFTKISK